MSKIKTISASQINTYQTCPLQWYYNYILKLLQLPNQNFIIGTAYHKCTERFHKNENKDIIIEEMKRHLLEIIDDEMDEKIKAIGIVRKMFEKYIKNPVKGKPIELELQFTIKIPGIPVPLFGYIDRFDEDKIVEYKTSSFDYTLNDIETIQSKIYTYAIFKEKGKLLPVYYSVNNKTKINNDNYIPQELKICYNEQDMKELQQFIIDFYNEIHSKSEFSPKQGTHCKWCSFGDNGTKNCPYAL
jgi:DNA helicase II / ATP-dependent DNA helicase PcrA